MQKKWDIGALDRSACAGLSKELKISVLLAHLLLRRNITQPAEARAFLSCSPSFLHDAFLLKDMEKAVARIVAAIGKREKIFLYGDYDVDGLTATALLFSTLKEYGADTRYYIPDRVREGYGLNAEALGNACRDGAGLIISIDCGITSVEEVDFLRGRGIDCVIVDHHQPLKCELPRAYAIINPLQPGCGYPYKDLTAVGLAFKLAQALSKRLGRGRKEESIALEEHLDLVALGTICDVAAVTGENRVLIKHGLRCLAQTRKKGLRALIEVAGIGRKRQFFTETAAFILGPRINASGRVGSSMRALELLLTEDERQARILADELDGENRRRQAVEEAVLKEAISKIERDVNFKSHRVIVVSSDKWHPGVIGIVASRIVERFYRPTILVVFNENLGRGSGRSIRNFHLFEALCRCKEHLVEYGGHEYAAGITLARDKLDAFRQQLNSIAHENLSPSDLIPRLEIDAEVSLSDISADLIKELSLLEPFGVHNPKPVFVVRDLSLRTKPKETTSKTLRMWVTDGELTYEAVGFMLTSDFIPQFASRKFSLAFTPVLNDWRGEEAVRLQLKDVKF